MTEEENIIKVGSLPDIVPVFPLPGALVFPGASLPLNIFEPRYLSMTNDSLAKGRWIGMVQPRDTMEHPVPDKVGIFEVGSLTRITSYENIDEKRVLITLTGITRFNIESELEPKKGYRIVKTNYGRFENDLQVSSDKLSDRGRLISAAESYFQRMIEEIDLSDTSEIDDASLLNALCMASPFTVAEKQALLECSGVAERGELLSSLMEMASLGDDTSSLSDLAH